jgi:hypothetical protein
MGIHPIFQDITDAHRGRSGLRPLGDVIPAVMDTVERAVVAKRGVADLIRMRAFADGWEAPASDSERGLMLAAALEAKGMSYSFRGRQPNSHDAWSLLRTCAAKATSRDCIDIERHDPAPLGMTEDRARMAFTQWGLVEVKPRYAEPGDVLLIAIDGGVHAGVLSSPGGETLSWSMLPGKEKPEAQMVHAFYGASVTESFLGPYWMHKKGQLIAAFSFDAPSSPMREEQARAA